jgi:hypothetical protein
VILRAINNWVKAAVCTLTVALSKHSASYEVNTSGNNCAFLEIFAISYFQIFLKKRKKAQIFSEIFAIIFRM